MDIVWLMYNKNNSCKYLLCLYLGENDEKFYVICNDYISSSSRLKIKSMLKLSKFTKIDKIGWIKKHCPEAMNGFRSLLKTKTKILRTYQIGD